MEQNIYYFLNQLYFRHRPPPPLLPQFHAMVLSCRSGFLDSMLGLNRSQHLALLTQRLYHCLADHTLIQVNTHAHKTLTLCLGFSPGWTLNRFVPRLFP